VRSSWRPRNQASAVLMAGLIAVPVASAPHLAVRVQPSGTPRPTVRVQPSGTPRPSVRVHAPAGPALTISVSDGQTAANPGDRLTYVVTLRDVGRAGAQHLEVTQTLSPGLDFLSASPRETAVRGKVTWRAAIAAGGTQTFRMVARVTHTPARLLRLAAVACASAQGGGRPIVCAAHLDRLPAAASASGSVSRSGRPAGMPALAYAGVALAVLVAAALAVLARRRGRGRRQAG
jgi:uncharacterized repeat protein (TIGR01451 family)